MKEKVILKKTACLPYSGTIANIIFAFKDELHIESPVDFVPIDFAVSCGSPVLLGTKGKEGGVLFAIGTIISYFLSYEIADYLYETCCIEMEDFFLNYGEYEATDDEFIENLNSAAKKFGKRYEEPHVLAVVEALFTCDYTFQTDCYDKESYCVRVVSAPDDFYDKIDKSRDASLKWTSSGFYADTDDLMKDAHAIFGNLHFKLQ